MHNSLIANLTQFRSGRKRHGVTDKEEMERSVTYESYPTDLSEGIESFQSPDTVCQYCGTDFKFFRALKHHLKTHSSCRQKPFTCTKCLVKCPFFFTVCMCVVCVYVCVCVVCVYVCVHVCVCMHACMVCVCVCVCVCGWMYCAMFVSTG